MNYETIILEIKDGKARVTLNRPERYNAMTLKMFDELDQVCRLLRDDDGVRVVVITGRGRAFCSGADLHDLAEELNVNDSSAVRQALKKAGQAIYNWYGLEKPVIAAINGAAVGGGLNLALMCDLTIAREDAVLAQIYTQRSLSLDLGGTYFLPRLVGMARAKQMALLGDAVSAMEAQRIGLISKWVPVDQFEAVVEEWADRLAKGASKAIGMVKTGLNQSEVMDLGAMLEYEAYSMAMSFQTRDFSEALAAFREKREAVFTGK
ncbi:MAG: enoyl-CoA hydratase-related protein [Peptococcaceae bacterium]|jgi:2-(1,2-epoxy-1,2-dihydrophenyl)acetyl-CoA isomerase|nr:enoyl-CoA hydratase-related protein [Peptococcaceae bacterium]